VRHRHGLLFESTVVSDDRYVVVSFIMIEKIVIIRWERRKTFAEVTCRFSTTC
jgi:hypothetical protein